MNITAATAHADQLHAHLINARDCDALDPCDSCRSMRTEVHAIRHAARVVRMVSPGTRTTMLRQRLAAAVS